MHPVATGSILGFSIAAPVGPIGLLVLRKDHGIRVGVRFGEDEQGRPTITVRAFQTLEGV